MSYDTQKNDMSASEDKKKTSMPVLETGGLVGTKLKALAKLDENSTDISALQTLAACNMQLNEFEAARKTYEEQYKNLTNYELIFAEGASHFIMYDKPDWFLNTLKSKI